MPLFGKRKKSKDVKTLTRKERIDQRIKRAGEHWEFAGWGTASKIHSLGKDPVRIKALGVSSDHAKKLDEWSATAICGNDITSSCLYVSALSIMAAGVYAPLALLVVACVLFLFRKIYAEVGSAIPLNGGTYTVLLNTTNKRLAAGAACLTLLSYIATAVISANEAMHYLHTLWHGFDVQWATIALLALFAFLNVLGIVESARVALGIFIFHMLTLTVLVVAGTVVLIKDPSTLIQNFTHFPLPEGRGVLKAIFLGFGAAMLGISGFESSANFIEEQKEGVFAKTLKNMWIAVSVFNPIICFLALGLLTTGEVAENKEFLLAVMGDKVLGKAFLWVVSIDAVLVLSGAVLTSYVGVTGLARRMSLDRCLPQFFLHENSWRKTNHWIILAFFLLCTAILHITHGDVAVLAGVYTLSFLGVMALFAIGNMLLKKKRARLPRSTEARWESLIIALGAVFVGIVANLSVEKFKIFALFFCGMGVIVVLMFLRVHLLKLAFILWNHYFSQSGILSYLFSKSILRNIDENVKKQVIYFSRGDNIVNLNRAALYVMDNEQTNNLQVIHVFTDEEEIPADLARDLNTLDKLYPNLRIDFLAIKGDFGPELIERVSQFLDVPKNYMFIGTPGDHFPHTIAELGGVRLIL